MEKLEQILMKPFDVIADYAWQEWEVHPWAIARQFFAATAVCGGILLFLTISMGRNFTANTWLHPYTPILIMSVASLSIGRALFKKGQPIVSAFNVALALIIVPLALFGLISALMEIGAMWANQSSGKGQPIGLLMPLCWFTGCLFTTYRLFSKPLPMSGTVSVEHLPRNTISVSYLMILGHIFASTAWLLNGGGLEAIYLMVTVSFNFLARGFNTIEPPKPGHFRQSKSAFVFN